MILRTVDWYLPVGTSGELAGLRLRGGLQGVLEPSSPPPSTGRPPPTGSRWPGCSTAFSGPDLSRDMPREYMSNLGPSAEGAAAIADVLAALGYEPVGP